MLPDGALNSCPVCLPMFISFAFDEAGTADSAIVYMEQALTTFEPNGKNADSELPVVVDERRARVRRLTDIEGIPR